MGPIEERSERQKYGHHPRKHVEIFKQLNVSRVIRLNEARYDKATFTNAGIKHNDLEFVDGSCPPPHIV
jgi:cell division cycle 14